MGRTLATPRGGVENSARTIFVAAKMSKYEFRMKEILYIGKIIGKYGVKYQGHLRMAITKKHIIKRFHWNMYIL